MHRINVPIFLKGILILFVVGCQTTSIEGLHDANKSRDIETVGKQVDDANNSDPNVRRQAVKLLGGYPLADALPYLKVAASDSNSRVRAQTAKTLGEFNDKQTLALLTALAQDKSNKTKAWAIRGLGGVMESGDAEQIAALKGNLSTPDMDLKLATAELLAKIGSKEGHVETIKALNAQYYTDVRKAIKTLKYYKDEDDLRYLTKFLSSKDSVTRKLAVESIEYIRGEKMDEASLQVLRDEVSGRKPALRAKPTIYVATPKSGEQVADASVDFIGYINAHNRTDKIEVFVNNKQVPVDNLWSGIKINIKGLRGFPVRWSVPVKVGSNKIDLNVLDKAGFLVSHSINVKRIKLQEKAPTVRKKPSQIAGLPQRMESIDLRKQDQNVTPENFMAVLDSWVKDTAKSDYNKGNSMYNQGRYERAAYYYKKSIKTDPMSQAYFNLGLAQKALGQDDEAKKSFNSACEMKEEQGCRMGRSQSSQNKAVAPIYSICRGNPGIPS